MNKIFLLFIAVCSSLLGFEKLDSKYCISYGNPKAQIEAIEYFSLSCPKCLEFFQKEFPVIKQKHIDPGLLHWTFHPDPADLLTLQAMVCLNTLPEEQKILFLECLVRNLTKLKSNIHGCRLMQIAMEVFEKPLPDLEKVEFLEKTDAFQDAFLFLTQKDVIRIIPSIELDGTMYKEYPNAAFVEAQIHNKLSMS